MNPLDSVVIPFRGLSLVDEQDGARLWETEEGDIVGLYYFGGVPDLPTDLDSLETLQQQLSKRVSGTGAAVVDIQVTRVDGCRAVQQIVKVPQKPTGMTYIGSFVLPFRDFSFVVKFQCQEHGPTGLRDAAVYALTRASAQVDVERTERGTSEWMKDPYDLDRVAGLARNHADDEMFDPMFPDHPLSRVRWLLNVVGPIIAIDGDIKRSPPFVGRAAASTD